MASDPFQPDFARRVPAGGVYQPDRLASEQPDPDFRENADAEIDPTDGGRLFRRLVLAFAAIVALLAVNFLLLDRFGLGLEPEILVGSFGVIAVAGIVAAFQSAPKSDADDAAAAAPEDEGCAVGLCPGPRPPRFLRPARGSGRGKLAPPRRAR